MAFSTAFFRDYFQTEVDSAVTTGVAVEQVGMDARVKFVDSRSNGSRDIQTVHFVVDDNDGRRS